MKMVLAFVVSFAAILASFGWIAHGLTESHRGNVLAHARGIAEVVTGVRKVYTSHRTSDSVLPLTLTEYLADEVHSCDITIYSPFPFPRNSERGGLRDSFQRRAWQKLAVDGQTEFFEWADGRLRYAVPDVMTQKCVECHNQADGTPKSDWKIGDVRGIIEICVQH